MNMPRRGQPFQESGYQPIDTEHQHLSEALARLLDAVNANDRKLAVVQLAGLVSQYASHFAHEERLMAESQYQLTERHKQAHAVVLQDATKFLAELTRHGLSPSFRRWATGRALEGFRLHIAANDVGLGRFLASRAPTRRE
jgi:hemerythrin